MKTRLGWGIPKDKTWLKRKNYNVHTGQIKAPDPGCTLQIQTATTTDKIKCIMSGTISQVCTTSCIILPVFPQFQKWERLHRSLTEPQYLTTVS